MDIRPETEGDTDSIRRLTTAAFAGAAHSSGTEAAIIDRLRDTGSLVLSLVGGFEGRIVAHVAFSPVRIGGQDLGWVGLGPVSVWPEQQGRGLGRAVIAEGLRRVAEQGAAGCVVLGDPAYYRRFGFEADAGPRFAGAPPEYFLRLRFAGAMPAGDVTYPPAFYD